MSDATTATAPEAPESTDTGDTTDYKAEAEKWQALARKHEERAKANASAAKELEQVRQSSMSDVEKAVAIARAEERAAVLREAGTRLVDAEVRAALTGRPVDAAALLEGLDRSRFLNDDGDPDVKAIQAWVDRIAPQTEPKAPSFDLGQGARGDAPNVALNGDPLYRDLINKLGVRG